jgi:tetratricopeptide (TPR) repeat protein
MDIFRKLTGRRKRTKPCQSITLNTSTESSHVSELEPKARRPLQLQVEVDVDDDVDEKHPPKQEQSKTDLRSRSQSISVSSTQDADSPPKPSSSRFPSRFQSKDRSSPQVVDSTPKFFLATPPLKPEIRKGRRFSFGKPPLSDTKIETPTAAATGTPASSSPRPRRRSQPRFKEDHEVFAPPGLKPKSVRFIAKSPSARGKNNNLSVNIQTENGGMTEQEQRIENEKQLALNKEAERIARAASALDHRGNEYFERGYFDKAFEAYSKALKLKRRTFHSMMEDADDFLDEDKLEKGDTDPKLLVSMATSINNIGYLRQRSGDATPDETMAAYNKSLRIKRKILGNDSLSVGKTLNNIGSVHYLKKEFDGALPAYEEAYQIMQANLGEGHPDVATVISNMGDVQLAKGLRDKSLELYRSALGIRWTAFGDKDPRTIRLLEKIARIEIGDKMPTPRGSSTSNQSYDWEESELFDLDMIPLTTEFQHLHSQVEEDMQYVDLLQKKMAVDMVKDKVNILRGMRELMTADDRKRSSRSEFIHEGSDREDSQREDSYRGGEDGDLDEGILPGISPQGGGVSRHQAQEHIKERLARLRSQKINGPDIAEAGHISRPSLSESTSNLEQSSSTFFGASFYARNQRPALSTLQPEEIKGNVDDLRSALKLRKGIDSLRSFTEDEKPKSSNSMLPPVGDYWKELLAG